MHIPNGVDQPLSLQQVFTRIFESNLWGVSESVSGPGSTRERASVFAPHLLDMLLSLKVESVLDAGCGDFNWMKDLDLGTISYTGIDVVEAIVNKNKRKFASPTRQFIHGDLTEQTLSRVGAILCRDCLVHLSFAQIHSVLKKFKDSGSQYLFATTFLEHPVNQDIPAGHWRPLNLQIEPYSFPPPIAVIKDRPKDPKFKDKRLALWTIDSLPL